MAFKRGRSGALIWIGGKPRVHRPGMSDAAPEKCRYIFANKKHRKVCGSGEQRRLEAIGGLDARLLEPAAFRAIIEHLVTLRCIDPAGTCGWLLTDGSSEHHLGSHDRLLNASDTVILAQCARNDVH